MEKIQETSNTDTIYKKSEAYLDYKLQEYAKTIFLLGEMVEVETKNGIEVGTVSKRGIDTGTYTVTLHDESKITGVPPKRMTRINPYGAKKLEACMKKKSISMLDAFKKMFLKQSTKDNLIVAKIIEIAHVLYVANANSENIPIRKRVQNELRSALNETVAVVRFEDVLNDVYRSKIWDEMFTSFNIPLTCVQETFRVELAIDLYIGVNILKEKEINISDLVTNYGEVEDFVEGESKYKYADPVNNYLDVIVGGKFLKLTDEPLALKF